MHTTQCRCVQVSATEVLIVTIIINPQSESAHNLQLVSTTVTEVVKEPATPLQCIMSQHNVTACVYER